MNETSQKTVNVVKTPTVGTMVGVVVSAKMKDTVVVAVTRFVKHYKYKKYLKTTKRFKAHDKGNVCKEGDTVTIKGCRPISKDKHFVVAERKPKILVEDIDIVNVPEAIS